MKAVAILVVIVCIVFLCPGIEALGARLASAQNLLSNGGFEVIASGKPVGWVVGSGGSDVSLSSDLGRCGGRSIKVAVKESYKGWVVLAQDKVVPIEKGRNYRVTFWIKGKGGEYVMVNILRLDNWRPAVATALDHYCVARRGWTKQSYYFKGESTTNNTRFEFALDGGGTVWIDDVEIVLVSVQEVTDTIPTNGVVNAIPNSSFELGIAGWGTDGSDSLIGTIDRSTAVDGRCSFKLRLAPETYQTAWFDWPEPRIVRLTNLKLASIGWLKLYKDEPYTFSTYLKSDVDGLTVNLALERSAWVPDEGTFEPVKQYIAIRKQVRVTREWRRYSFTAELPDELSFVTVGPDLKASGVNRATLWVDALQLEPGKSATKYRQRRLVEAGLSTDRIANLFYRGEKVDLRVRLRNAGRDNADVPLFLSIQDFGGRSVVQKRLRQTVSAGRTVNVTVPTGLKATGFYSAKITVGSGDQAETHVIPMGVIFPYKRTYGGKSSFFGINHAFPTDLRMKLAKDAGISWVRDWSTMWDVIEPEKGCFDFSVADKVIDRAMSHGMRVQACLSQPSSRWSSTAPPEAAARYGQGEPIYRMYEPKNITDFENYVYRVVRHFGNRVKHWEILNEPFYKFGVDGQATLSVEQYFELLQAGYRAAKRAKPDCTVIGGPAMDLMESQFARYRKLFEMGGLHYIDATNQHVYTGDVPDYAAYDALNTLMDRCGGRKPIWLNEYGVYGDDSPGPSCELGWLSFADHKNAEQLAAEALVRLNTAALGNGAVCVMQHPLFSVHRVNRDIFPDMMFGYDGLPRKGYVAMNILAWMLPPGTSFDKKMAISGLLIYIFKRGGKRVGIVWSERPVDLSTAARRRIEGRGVRFLDVMGNPIPAGPSRLSLAPVYIVGSDSAIEEAVAVIRAVID
ncbi:MAG: carbohydrate binding domain-containing protein [Armatimonadetes bacterium]|nr:carbohydrate binding domain-containing protein [Armatimonadota bacterium]